MNSQNLPSLGQRGSSAQEFVVSGQALTVSPWPGELTVVDGRVWVTRSDDLGDHVLEAGRSIRFGADSGLVIEPWGESATVQWRRQPQAVRPPVFLAVAFAAGLRSLAGLAGGTAAALRSAEAGLAALARKAASSAMRAQFCISGGDSMASSGALK
jgi:Protein of unknown function (DUF2917)